jgi:DNA-binding XRE family transcriptional regulator
VDRGEDALPAPELEKRVGPVGKRNDGGIAVRIFLIAAKNADRTMRRSGHLATSKCFGSARLVVLIHRQAGVLFYVAISKSLSLAFVNACFTSIKRKMEQRIKRLLGDVEAWCVKKRGRQTELAGALGVQRQLLNQWLKGKVDPSSEMTLALIEFLEDPEEFCKPRRGIK